MVSRICQEDTQQQEENQRLQDTSWEDTKGFKTLAEKNTQQKIQEETKQQEENQGLQDTCQEDTKGFKTPAEKNVQQEIQEKTSRSKYSPDWLTEGIVFKTLVGSASVVSKSAVDVGCDTLPHGMCGKECFFRKFYSSQQFQTYTKQDLGCNFRIIEEDVYWKKTRSKTALYARRYSGVEEQL